MVQLYYKSAVRDKPLPRGEDCVKSIFNLVSIAEATLRTVLYYRISKQSSALDGEWGMTLE